MEIRLDASQKNAFCQNRDLSLLPPFLRHLCDTAMYNIACPIEREDLDNISLSLARGSWEYNYRNEDKEFTNKQSLAQRTVVEQHNS